MAATVLSLPGLKAKLLITIMLKHLAALNERT